MKIIRTKKEKIFVGDYIVRQKMNLRDCFIDKDLLNFALDKEIVTETIFNECKNIVKNWSSVQYSRNDEIIKTPGVYILSNERTGQNYVGQAKNIKRRIQQHLSYKYPTTSKLDFIEDCSIFCYPVLLNENELECKINVFLDILEQYLILLKKPNINKIWVVRHGGNSSHRETYILYAANHLFSKPLFIYKLNKGEDDSSAILIQELPSIGSLGVILDIQSKGQWSRIITRNSGFIRGSVYCTTIPLETIKVEKISKEDFVAYVKELLKVKTKRMGYSYSLVNVETNEKIGPFPSATYICKHILPGGDRSVFSPSRRRIKPYRGYYIIFED